MSRNDDTEGSAADTLALLRRRFKRHPVAELEDLCRTVRRSGRTVFRALEKLGYHSSYSHAGRYYTLRTVPRFDERGLWFHGEARFSAHGTLRATIVVLVQRAPAGHTHEELEVLLGLRVHDTLRSLCEAKELGRERIDGVYVYVDPDPGRAAAQLERRRRPVRAEPARVAPPPSLDLARVVDVLLAVIHAPKDDARMIAARLRAAGLAVEDAQVAAVFSRYDLGKKTARSRSRRSPR